MKPYFALFPVLLFVLAPASSLGQGRPNRCRDAAEDSHYTIVFENNRARVLTLELGHMQGTIPHCDKGPYISIVSSASKTTNRVTGQVGVPHQWIPGEARFHYRDYERTIYNETWTEHHEVIVESFLPFEWNPLWGDYDLDAFPHEVMPQKAASVSFTRGALTATRVTLPPQTAIDFSSADHVIIAIGDAELTTDGGQQLHLANHEVLVKTGGQPKKIANTGTKPAEVVIVDF